MVILKQPSEFLLVGIDMAPALAPGETVAQSSSYGALSAAVFDDDGLDVSATIIAAPPTITGSIVQVMIKGGLGVLNVRFLVPTSANQILEEDLIVAVAEQKQT